MLELKLFILASFVMWLGLCFVYPVMLLRNPEACTEESSLSDNESDGDFLFPVFLILSGILMAPFILVLLPGLWMI